MGTGPAPARVGWPTIAFSHRQINYLPQALSSRAHDLLRQSNSSWWPERFAFPLIRRAAM
jgi:hypothetical protein